MLYTELLAPSDCILSRKSVSGNPGAINSPLSIHRTVRIWIAYIAISFGFHGSFGFALQCICAWQLLISLFAVLCLRWSMGKIGKMQGFFIFLFIATIFSIPRSYPSVRAMALVAFLAFSSLALSSRRQIWTSKGLFVFYSIIAFVGSFWSILGITNNAYMAGISDSFRLYVIWSLVYFAVFTILLNVESVSALHRGFVVAGLFIALINIVTIADTYWGWGLVPVSMKKELDLRVGFHEGYVQITTQNIGSLFFIVPYLMAIQLRKDFNVSKRRLESILLVLLLTLCILSGRRALWLCVLATPVLVVLVAIVGKSTHLLRLRSALFAYPVVGLASAFILLTLGEGFGLLEHLKSAFSAQDERSIQKGFLLSGFSQYPFFGVGFGKNAGYTRSRTAPWIYELTYHQLLFNIGIVGVLILATTIGVFIFQAIKTSSKSSKTAVFSFGSTVGVLSFFIGAYSNPYFGSFDFLIILGFIPFIAALGVPQMQYDRTFIGVEGRPIG